MTPATLSHVLQGLSMALADHDLDFPGIAQVRDRLNKLKQQRPELFVTETLEDTSSSDDESSPSGGASRMTRNTRARYFSF